MDKLSIFFIIYNYKGLIIKIIIVIWFYSFIKVNHYKYNYNK